MLSEITKHAFPMSFDRLNARPLAIIRVAPLYLMCGRVEYLHVAFPCHIAEVCEKFVNFEWIFLYAPCWLWQACYQCGEEFTTNEQKHHCRACGQGFCDKCSTHKRRVPERGWKDELVRVCDKCYAGNGTGEKHVLRLHTSPHPALVEFSLLAFCDNFVWSCTFYRKTLVFSAWWGYRACSNYIPVFCEPTFIKNSLF